MGAFFVSNIESLYPHNKKVFLEAIKNLKTHKKLGIVQATGTGKGKLASCFVEHVLKRKPNAKILILAPLHTILDNYRDNFGLTDSEVFFNTYKMLLNFDKTYLHNLGLTYDLIIVDEFHRLGAEKWGPAVKTIFDGVDSPKSNCRVIGFTATPIRYLDNARDMSDELFGGNVIQGLNLEDAICEGILPGFVYNACYFSTEDKLTEVEKKLASNDYKIVDDTIRNDLMVKVKELRMLYHNKLKIENILRETTKDLGATQKWIIFCRDKDSLDEIREICKTWFVSVPSLYVIHSDKYRSDNRRILKEFRESKSGVNVMLCIDMLNEGVHIKDIDGIIMLRKTDSPIIFLQQLGRALEAGKTTQPLIYDLVGNYKDLKVENGDGLVGHTISIVKGIADKVNKKRSSNCVIVRNFVEDFDNVMGELSQYLPGRSWEKWEDEILFKYYQEGGSHLCQEKGLSDRSISSIQSRAHILGLKCDLVSDWSNIEIENLKLYFEKGGPILCQEKGLNRSASSIYYMAKKLGLQTSRYWSPDEDSIIITNYEAGGASLCIEKGLKRSISAIKRRAQELGVYSSKKWSDFEINILTRDFEKGGVTLCIKNGLTSRSPVAIEKAARRYGLIYVRTDLWLDWEDEIVKRDYPIGGYILCQQNGLGHRTMSSIKGRARKLGCKLNQGIKLSSEQESIIKTYYPLGGYSLCQEMGLANFSKHSIMRYASLLGVAEKRNSWSEWEDLIIVKYYPLGGATLCIEKGICRSKDSIYNRAKKLGIKVVTKK